MRGKLIDECGRERPARAGSALAPCARTARSRLAVFKMTRTALTILVLLGLTSSSVLAFASAHNDESLGQLIARADAAPPGEKPSLYIKIARYQADAADKAYMEGDSDAGNKALGDVVTYSEKASDAAGTTGKKIKDTEIALRKMSEKFRDVKHNLPFDDQAPVQQAIDRLEKMRTDLLSVMFSKKGKK